jgi:hypothetical protein
LAEPTAGAGRRLRRLVRPFRRDRGDGNQAGRSARGGCPICEGCCLRPVGRTPVAVDQRVLLFPWAEARFCLRRTAAPVSANSLPTRSRGSLYR